MKTAKAGVDSGIMETRDVRLTITDRRVYVTERCESVQRNGIRQPYTYVQQHRSQPHKQTAPAGLSNTPDREKANLTYRNTTKGRYICRHSTQIALHTNNRSLMSYQEEDNFTKKRGIRVHNGHRGHSDTLDGDNRKHHDGMLTQTSCVLLRHLTNSPWFNQTHHYLSC